MKDEDLDTVSDDFETANAHQYLWDATKLEQSRSAAVDFFISLALTAFFDGLEHSYPVLQPDDFKTTWQYLSAGALVADNLDTRLIADAEKVERHATRLELDRRAWAAHFRRTGSSGSA